MDLVTRLLGAAAGMALAAIVMWALKRNGYSRSARARSVEMLERVALGPQTALCLVRVRDREYVLAVAGSGITVVDTRGSGTHAGAPKGAIPC